MIRALIVDDSPVAAKLLRFILSSDPEIDVIGVAASGEEGIRLAASGKPDVITMDLRMPGIDGYAAARAIMETNPTPIVIVSGYNNKADVAGAMKALEAGALAVLDKPEGPAHPLYKETSDKLISTVKIMSSVKVVPRRKTGAAAAAPAVTAGRRVELIAIGASTGGPQALQVLLSALAGKVRAPVLIVQHITKGFAPGYAEWLTSVTGMEVKCPADGELCREGAAYLAPDDKHMGIDGAGRIILNSGPPLNNLRPAVEHLFRSAAASYGGRAAGILLTGMGKDGAAGLKLMRNAGAATFAQDAASCVVNGMPGEAVALGGAVYILTPEEIGAAVLMLTAER